MILLWTFSVLFFTMIMSVISDFNLEEVDSFISKVPISMSSDLEPKRETGTSNKVPDQSVHTSKTVAKEVRFKPITEEENVTNDTVAWQQSARPKSQSPTPRASPTLHFYSGNPSVEKVKGILHIYKDK